MPDLISALQLSAPEASLAVGGLVLLMVGAFAGEKSARFVSALAVLLLIGATALAVTGPLGQAFNGAYVADPLAVYGKALIFLSSAVAASSSSTDSTETSRALFSPMKAPIIRSTSPPTARTASEAER